VSSKRPKKDLSRKSAVYSVNLSQRRTKSALISRRICLKKREERHFAEKAVPKIAWHFGQPAIFEKSDSMVYYEGHRSPKSTR
jgi:hypothetical protein